MQPLIIGIAGGSGSGKTSVTQRILHSLESEDVVVVPHDAYYRDLEDFGGLSPNEINFDHPDSLETSLLIAHLKDLRHLKSVRQPVYDFSTHRRTGSTMTINPRNIVIVEGILIFVEKDLRDLMDIKIFIDADGDERLMRRIRRDMRERGRSIESVMDQYMNSVKPMHLEFVEPSKHWADVIIPRGADNHVAIDMVVTKIKSLMNNRMVGTGVSFS